MKISTLALSLACGLAATAFAASAGISPFQLADLRSFIHGEPAPPPKSAPPPQLATVSTADGIVTDSQVEDFLRALAKAVKARDGAPMLARLSDRYTIDDLPPDLKAATHFLQAVDAVPGPTEIIVKSVTRQNDVRVVGVEMRYGGTVKQKVFRFDAGGKLLWSDWFLLQTRKYGT